MMIYPFKVRVAKSARAKTEGGLKEGAIVTVRAFNVKRPEEGGVFIRFLVWNSTLKKFMLEEAWQFEPVDEADE